MSKYINAEKLVAEIERRKKGIDECPFIEAELGASIKRDVKIKTFNELISLITSLQQEQEQHVIGGRVFGATDIEQLYEGKVYIVSNLVQDTEFGIEPGDKVKMLLIKD